MQCPQISHQGQSWYLFAQSQQVSTPETCSHHQVLWLKCESPCQELFLRQISFFVLMTYTKSPTWEPSSCELSRMRVWVPPASGMSDVVARPPSPVADGPSAPPPPTSSPSSNQGLFLPVHSMPASVCQLLYYAFQGAVSSVQLLSWVQLFATPWTIARQASLSITNAQSLLKLMSIESMMPSNHLILCHPLLLPSVFRSIRVFSNESVLHIR